MAITWNESMSTGVARIDSQHRQLIQKFNEFSEILGGSNSVEIRQAAGDVLDFLQFYAAWHFKQEEDCMEQYRCPAAAANKNAHAEFLKQFGKLYETWQKGTMDLAMAKEAHARLSDWIVKHIIQIDTRLRPCVKIASPQ